MTKGCCCCCCGRGRDFFFMRREKGAARRAICRTVIGVYYGVLFIFIANGGLPVCQRRELLSSVLRLFLLCLLFISRYNSEETFFYSLVCEQVCNISNENYTTAVEFNVCIRSVLRKDTAICILSVWNERKFHLTRAFF